ncbi:uncharacterized protein [Amphiura filiformis]|uniref:uncharacterized protein n=1 Tax=Amphiura filiformis TaxID=82378 RepID=UPI003B214585
MNKLVAHMIRCSRWHHLPRGGASFSTSSRRFDDLWGKMASGQELQANVQQTKVHKKRLDEEREEALRKMQQLKDTIRESEQKLTGLQRMKYKQEEYDKEDVAFEQMRGMRNGVSDVPNIEIQQQVSHSVQEIRNDVKFKFIQFCGNFITSAGLFMVCFFLWKTLNRKVDERRAAQEAEAASGAAGTVESNTVKESAEVIETKEDASIFA